MKLSELLAAYGDDNIQFQNLDQSATSLNMRGHTTTITFGTDQPLRHDGMEKLGLVIWLDRERVKEIIAPKEPSDGSR